MIRAYNWIASNWEHLTVIAALMVLFILSGGITKTLRAAMNGLKEAVTPLGMFIVLVLAYLIYQLYLTL